MAKPFKNLTDEMSPESKRRVEVKTAELLKEFDDPCPDCGEQLRAKSMQEGGGVECPNPSCSYWFCF